MFLYERDYRLQPKKEEIQEYNIIRESEVLDFPVGRINKYLEYPRAMRHYMSLFPNNLMEINDYKENALLDVELFEELLGNNATKERDILTFINKGKYFHIIASLLSGGGYSFGHHATYLFPEFELRNNYKVDYLLVGKSSGGYEFLFVELESPYGRITTSDGELGESFRKGLSQVKDWNRLLQANYIGVSETYNKYIKAGESLPKEFYRYDSSRIHFAVIAGRRSDFKENTYRLKREYSQDEDIKLFHYDNLIDYAKNNLDRTTY